jgi:2-succinyl-5-enolpyruvyl-6-hydroxy-3-cyclohexene-1-carboxylate synthase
VTPDPNLNALWARCIAEELRRAGCARAVLCPGSRNSPLLFAFAAELGDGCLSHSDERSAAFLALGMIKAGGKPVAVCVTSGSALANCLPALTEAHATGLPLIIVAADRPWELHGTGAPQSMPQAHGLAAWLAHEVALGEPTLDDRALRVLRARISRATQVPGPVLINVPLRDPLPPLPERGFATAHLSEVALRGRGTAPYTEVVEPYAEHLAGSVGWTEPDWLRPGLRGLILVGAAAESAIDPKPMELAVGTGFPLLADAASGLRDCGLDGLVTLADALVAGPMGSVAPELVIQVGPAPLSRALYEWLDRHAPRWICLEPGDGQDWLARAELAIRRPGIQAYHRLAERLGRGDEVWRARWLAAEAAARSRLVTAMHAAEWGEPLAAHHALIHPGFAFTAIGNSMAARHANLHLPPTVLPRPVVATRGVAGIDGNLGTFLGASVVLGRGLLLCGDLTALHDLPALAALPALGAGGTIVILDNGGGGIFDYLAVAQVPDYARWVRTSHQRDLAPLLAGFGLEVHQVSDAASLRAALDRAALGGWHAIICLVRDTDNVSQHRTLLHTLATA